MLPGRPSGTYVRTASRELAVLDDRKEPQGAGRQLLAARTDLRLVEARALLVERGLAGAAGEPTYYWYIPPSAAQTASRFKVRTDAGDAADAPRPGDLAAPAEAS